MRTLLVYDVVAKALDRPVSVEVCRVAVRVVTDLGGQYATPHNARHFVCVRVRGAELVPATGKTAMQLMGAWNRRLEREGLGAEPDELPKYRPHRADINLAMFERMRRDYWQQRRNLDVWGLYMEGMSEEQIAAQTGMHKSSVHRVVASQKARMNRPTGQQGRSDGEEICEVDPDGDS